MSENHEKFNRLILKINNKCQVYKKIKLAYQEATLDTKIRIYNANIQIFNHFILC